MEDWRFDRSQVDPISVLFQAVKGLTYLHAMGIGEVIESRVTTLCRLFVQRDLLTKSKLDYQAPLQKLPLSMKATFCGGTLYYCIIHPLTKCYDVRNSVKWWLDKHVPLRVQMRVFCL